MADALKAVDSARKVFSKRGGMLRTVDALRLVSILVRFTNFVTEGSLNVLAGDSTASPLQPHLTNPDWVTVAIRAPHAVVWPDIRAGSSWYDNNRFPHTIDLAIPSHGQIPKVDALPNPSVSGIPSRRQRRS